MTGRSCKPSLRWEAETLDHEEAHDLGLVNGAYGPQVDVEILTIRLFGCALSVWARLPEDSPERARWG